MIQSNPYRKIDRDLSFDALRGLGIIAVVAIHAINVTARLFKYDIYSINTLPMLLYEQLFVFGVPIFLFMSGYWMETKLFFTPKNYGSSVINRFIRLLVPYLFWSLLVFMLRMLNSEGLTPKQMLYQLLTGSALFPYYFILLLCQLNLLTPIIRYLNRTMYGITTLIMINACGMCIIYILRLVMHYDIPMVLYAVPFYSWLIFYQLGMAVGNNNQLFNYISKAYYWKFIVIFCLLEFIECSMMTLYFNDLSAATTAIKFSSFLFSISIIIILYTYRSRFANVRLLILLGKLSFGIYFIHMLVMPAIGNHLGAVPQFPLVPFVIHIFITTMTLLLCGIIIKCASLLIPDKIRFLLLGFH